MDRKEIVEVAVPVKVELKSEQEPKAPRLAIDIRTRVRAGRMCR